MVTSFLSKSRSAVGLSIFFEEVLKDHSKESEVHLVFRLQRQQSDGICEKQSPSTETPTPDPKDL